MTPAFAWRVEGERHRPGSSPEYWSDSDSGAIEAEGAGEALEMIVTGRGDGATIDNTIKWDLFSQFRPITIEIWPVDTDPGPSDGAA